MKRLLILLTVILAAGWALAADDSLNRGMKLYKQNRYDAARGEARSGFRQRVCFFFHGLESAV